LIPVLWKRVLTAAVLLPLLVGIVLYGKGWPFTLLVECTALLCAREYFRMFFPSPREWWVGIALTGLIYASGALLPFPLAVSSLLCIVALAVFHFLRVEGTMEERVRGAALTVLGAVYLGGFLSAYPRVIHLPRGEHWVFLGLVTVVAGDTVAYFAGRAWGKRPLSPRISPNKTVEGAVGGFLASALGGAAYAAAFLPAVPSWFALCASAVLGAVGQCGDLFESMLKRAAGVKDSGTLLPGHGGMFDRADALVAAGPPLYLLSLLSPLVGGP